MDHKLIKYIKYNRLSKIKKLGVKDPYLVLDRRGRTALHIAAKYGSAEVMEYLIYKLECNPWRIKDSKGNFPLHYSIKYCLKHYSRGNVKELVNVLLTSIPSGGHVLNSFNNKGTSLKKLLNALNTKSQLEDEKLVSPSLNSSSSSDGDEWTNKLKNEYEHECFEETNKFDFYESHFTNESFDQMADRIYNEYIRKKTGKIKSDSVQKHKPLPVPSQTTTLIIQKDRSSYSTKCEKLFDSNEMIRVADIPFSIHTPSSEIMDTILGDEVTRVRIRKELIRWHPDKFLSKLGTRIRDTELDNVKKVIDHISQSLIQFGNR